MSVSEQNNLAVSANISIIDTVQVSQVHQTMQKIAQFQAVIQKTLKKDHDYGVIPGTGNKPTLLKPGAEKILMLMGLTSEYELVEKVQDYDTGFFAFTVKCTIWKGGTKITEGMGHANTREKRYTSGNQQDAFTLANTVLKMAKKRAQVDAVLTVASLSEIFTQDLEDFEFEQEPKQFKSQKEKSSEQQQKAIHAIAKKVGINDINDIVKAKYGVESTKDLTKAQASELITYLQSAENNPGVDEDIPF